MLPAMTTTDTRQGTVEVVQIGAVVRDLQAAMSAYYDTLGWGPWSIYELTPPIHHDTAVRGEPVAYSMKIAIAKVGGVDFELIEPLEGPSPYREFLDEHGEGLHHVLIRQVDEDGNELEVDPADYGFAPLMSGLTGETASYAYLDSEHRLGIILETYRAGSAPGHEPDEIYPPRADHTSEG
jgi:methylmalonyl-CoA/ethylmalonyl-CoA epimerase